MNIEVRIRKLVNSNPRLKAMASVTLDGKIAIHDIKLIKRDDGSLFVAMPSRKDETNVFRDIVHPVGIEARNELETAIIGAYKDCLAANSLVLNDV